MPFLSWICLHWGLRIFSRMMLSRRGNQLYIFWCVMSSVWCGIVQVAKFFQKKKEPITDVWSLEGLPVILFVLLFRGQSFGDPFLLHGPTNSTFAPSLLAENLTVDNEFSGSTGFHVTVVLAKSSHESCHDNVTCLVVLVVVLYHLSRQPKYGVKFPLVLCNIFHVQ